MIHILNLNIVEELMKRFSGLVIAACLTLLTSSAFGDTEMGQTVGISYFPYIPTERFDACA